MKQKYSLFYLSFIIIALCFSCKEQDNENSGDWTDEEKTDYINGWIYNNMLNWYYWNAYLPEVVDKTQAPKDFFESLLYAPDTRNGDRFSWLQENYIDLQNALSGYSPSEMGFKYQFVQYEENGSIYAKVLYVKKDTQAEKSGLKRGMDIATVDGVPMTAANYQSVLKANLSNYKLGILGENNQISLIEFKPDEEYSENPIHIDSVYEYGSKKVGYVMYNSFVSGTNGSKGYDVQLAKILTQFKDEGVNNLVLDLRYNSGGAVSSAAYLASALVPGRKSSNVFVNYEYNSYISGRISDSQRYEYFRDKIDSYSIPYLGDQLEHLYIITGVRSASASELIINGLNPFMESKIVQIGETTYGKNVASVTFIEENEKYKKVNKCGLQPIIAKLSNASGFSDYVDGFTPDYILEELWQPMYELGNENELLLAKALELITGEVRTVRSKHVSRGTALKQDREKKTDYNMYIDSGIIKNLIITE